MNRTAFFLITALLFVSCKEELPVVDDFGGARYDLVNQENGKTTFPDFIKGKIVVMNYIFTNCPDICPLSTNNMRLIQERLKKEKIGNVEFVSLSFDPQSDTPEALSKFAEIRSLDLNNWTFLTGDKTVTDAIIKKAGVIAVPGDSTVFKDGRKILYYIHTDRIQLIDTESRIRKNYKGSDINIEEIIGDLKSLR
ncbi:MAG: SCO family protein [Melioribacteraceae bacterium]